MSQARSVEVIIRHLTAGRAVIGEQHCPYITSNATSLVVGTPSLGWGNVQIRLSITNSHNVTVRHTYSAHFSIQSTLALAPAAGLQYIPPGGTSFLRKEPLIYTAKTRSYVPFV